jgi:hypothetical protein
MVKTIGITRVLEGVMVKTIGIAMVLEGMMVKTIGITKVLEGMIVKTIGITKVLGGMFLTTIGITNCGRASSHAQLRSHTSRNTSPATAISPATAGGLHITRNCGRAPHHPQLRASSQGKYQLINHDLTPPHLSMHLARSWGRWVWLWRWRVSSLLFHPHQFGFANF